VKSPINYLRQVTERMAEIMFSSDVCSSVCAEGRWMVKNG